jgi:hypothetical protein
MTHFVPALPFVQPGNLARPRGGTRSGAVVDAHIVEATERAVERQTGSDDHRSDQTLQRGAKERCCRGLLEALLGTGRAA